MSYYNHNQPALNSTNPSTTVTQIAQPTTHSELSTLQAALHGGLPPAMLRTWNTVLDTDSDSDNEPQVTRTRGRISSPALSTSSSEESGLSIQEPICTVVDEPRSIEIRERSALPRRFRGKDLNTSTKLFNIDTSSIPGDLLCVQCRSGLPLWRIVPSRISRTRILRKFNSPYYIALGATQWTKHLERKCHGYLHATSGLNRQPKLAIEIRGDALGKLFRILGIDNNNPVSLATCRRSTKFINNDGFVREVSRWTLHIEKNVDCAMIAAVVAVLEEWSAVGPQNSQRSRPSNNNAITSSSSPYK